MALADILFNYVSPTIAGLTVLLNLIEIVLLLKQYRLKKRSRRQRHVIPIILLMNLAFSDLLVGTTVVFIKIIHFLWVKKFITPTIEISWALHILKFAFLRLSLLTSVFNLISLTVDRFMAVCFPFGYLTKASNKHALLIVLITWLLSTTFTTAHYCISNFAGITLWQYDLIIFPAVVFPATLVFTVCYMTIVRVIHDQGRYLRSMGTDAGCNVNSNISVDTGHGNVNSNFSNVGNSIQNNNNSDKRMQAAFSQSLKREFKISKLAASVVLAFLICWLPIAFCGILLISDVYLDTRIVNFAFVLAFANSAIDPVIYFGFKDNFRRKLKNLSSFCLKGCHKCGKTSKKDVHLFSVTSSASSQVVENNGDNIASCSGTVETLM